MSQTYKESSVIYILFLNLHSNIWNTFLNVLFTLNPQNCNYLFH